MTRKKINLDWDANEVRFATSKDCKVQCLYMPLSEDQIDDSWKGAIEWIQDARQTSPGCKIYAVIETDLD